RQVFGALAACAEPVEALRARGDEQASTERAVLRNALVGDSPRRRGARRGQKASGTTALAVLPTPHERARWLAGQTLHQRAWLVIPAETSPELARIVIAHRAARRSTRQRPEPATLGVGQVDEEERFWDVLSDASVVDLHGASAAGIERDESVGG